MSKTETKIIAPQTLRALAEQMQDNPRTQIFVLFAEGPGTKVVAAGRSYAEMWNHAEMATGETRAQLLKNGLLFDVMPAARLLDEDLGE